MAAPTILSGLSTSIKVNGKDLHVLGYNVTEISTLDMSPVRTADEVFQNKHGKKAWGDRFDTRPIRLQGTVFGDSVSDLRDRIADLKGFFQSFQGVKGVWKATGGVWLERVDVADRHWLCLYDGQFTVGPIGPWRLAYCATLDVGLRAVSPFSEANDITEESYAGDAGTFKPLAMGSAPSEPIYALRGVATAPTLIVGDLVFHCDFDGDLVANLVTGTVTGAYSGTLAPRFSPGAYRQQFYPDPAETTTFNAGGMVGNKDEGSWLWIGRPQWASNTGVDKVIFRNYYDPTDYVQINYDHASDKWRFTKDAEGVVTFAYSAAQTFSSNDPFAIVGTYGPSGVKVYVNQVAGTSDASTAALESNPIYLRLYDHVNMLMPDAQFDFLVGWSRELDEEEACRFSSNPELIPTENVEVAYSENLGADDLLTLDAGRYLAELLSGASKANAMADVSGQIPVLMPNRSICYNAGAIGTIKVAYRKRWI